MVIFTNGVFVRVSPLIGLNQGHPMSSSKCVDVSVPLNLKEGSKSLDTLLFAPEVKRPFCSNTNLHPL